MRVKIVASKVSDTLELFQEKVNEALKDLNKVIDIKFIESVVDRDYYVNTAYILYED